MMALCFGLQRIHSVHTLVWLIDVCCLFAATDSHFRCFGAITSCSVGVGVASRSGMGTSALVMLHDGSVLQAATDSQCSPFGMVLNDVYCLFAAPDSHFRCFSAMLGRGTVGWLHALV